MRGIEIRRARTRAGLTQESLGALLGVGARTVRGWERGDHVPRDIARVVDALVQLKSFEPEDDERQVGDLDDDEILTAVAEHQATAAALQSVALDHQQAAEAHLRSASRLLDELALRRGMIVPQPSGGEDVQTSGPAGTSGKRPAIRP